MPINFSRQFAELSNIQTVFHLGSGFAHRRPFKIGASEPSARITLSGPGHLREYEPPAEFMYNCLVHTVRVVDLQLTNTVKILNAESFDSSFNRQIWCFCKM